MYSEIWMWHCQLHLKTVGSILSQTNNIACKVYTNIHVYMRMECSWSHNTIGGVKKTGVKHIS